MLDYLVIYESETGNTKKIATEIFSALPGMSKDLINIRERETLPDARIWFVGFCVHMGTCPMKTGSLLASLSGKAVALFGTCGAGNSPDYYKHIEASSRIWLEDDNLYLGAYFCQGKMPLQVPEIRGQAPEQRRSRRRTYPASAPEFRRGHDSPQPGRLCRRKGICPQRN